MVTSSKLPEPIEKSESSVEKYSKLKFDSIAIKKKVARAFSNMRSAGKGNRVRGGSQAHEDFMSNSLIADSSHERSFQENSDFRQAKSRRDFLERNVGMIKSAGLKK
jgi:hypothetical protein